MGMIRRMIALNPRQKKEQSRAFVTECPLSDYDTLTREGRLMQLVQRINNSTDDDEQRRLKGYLPFPALTTHGSVTTIATVSISTRNRLRGRRAWISMMLRWLKKPTGVRSSWMLRLAASGRA